MSNMLLQYREQLHRALAARLYFPALALSLALPDICSSIEHPRLKRQTRKRYSQWFDRWVASEFAAGGRTRMVRGVDCYVLRCAFLHRGTDDLTTQNDHEHASLDSIVLTNPVPGIGIRKYQPAQSGGQRARLALPVDDLCWAIDAGVERWRAHAESNGRKRRDLLKLAKLYDISAGP